MTTDATTAPANSQRFGLQPLGLLTGPGAFRLMLAAAVFVNHVSRFGVGRQAVVLFFMLSGYWVTRLYHGWPGSVATFEASRFLRIWPLLAVTSVLVWGMKLAGLLPPYGSLLSTLALLGLAIRQGDIIGVAWSLDLELQFYLLLPLCLWWINRRATGKAARGMALLAGLTALGIAASAHGWQTALAFAPAFAAGVGIYLYSWRPSGRAAALSVLVFLAVGVAIWMVPATHFLLDKPPMTVDLRAAQWWVDIVYTAWSLTLLPYVAWNVHQLSTPFDREMGNLSFPLYLAHVPMVGLAIHWAGAGLSAKVLALVLSVAATALLYLFVDRPIERWRSQLWRSGRRDKTTAAAGNSPP